MMNILLIFELILADSEANNLFKLINRFRRSNALYPFHRDARLDAAAREKAVDQEKNGLKRRFKNNGTDTILERLQKREYLDVTKVCESSAAINSFEHDSAINMMTNLTEHSLWKEPLLDNYTDVGISMIQNEDMGKKFWDVILARKSDSVEPPRNLVIEGTV